MNAREAIRTIRETLSCEPELLEDQNGRLDKAIGFLEDMFPQLPKFNVEQWKAKVLELHPTAHFTFEDGTGKTYGDIGCWTAHTGPDMQADVVAVTSHDYHDPGIHGGWIADSRGYDFGEFEFELVEDD